MAAAAATAEPTSQSSKLLVCPFAPTVGVHLK